MGDDYSDAYMDLLEIYDDSQMEVPSYPQREITYEMAQRFFRAYHEIESYFSYYVTTHKFTKPSDESYKDEIAPKLHSILDHYC